jgi:hypothetical protein
MAGDSVCSIGKPKMPVIFVFPEMVIDCPFVLPFFIIASAANPNVLTKKGTAV